MKKTYLHLLLFAGLFLGGCVGEEIAAPTIGPVGGEPLTGRIGYAEALREAERGIEMLESSPATRVATGRRTIDERRLRCMLRATTRSGAEAARDTLLYVFNFADSAGFALVASDRRSERLLAVTESGNFTPGEATGNPGFDLYMLGVENYLEELQRTYGLAPGEEPLIRQEISTRTESAGPLVTVAWGQYFPYNTFCFKPDGTSAPSGCVATAIAQIMSVWSYPSAIPITYPGADVAHQTLDWPVIDLHKRSYNCGPDCTEHLAIARLLREIGQQVGMKYGSQSGANYSAVPKCFAHFGYTTPSISDFNPSIICRNLDNHCPVYMRGRVVDDTGQLSGHAWVVDGYRRKITIFAYWATYPNGLTQMIDEQVCIDSYLHCNWGWDGSNNGYFSTGSFHTDHPDSLDPGSSNTEKYNFTLDLKIIHGIQPNT